MATVFIASRKMVLTCPAGDGGLEVADYRSELVGEFMAHHATCFNKALISASPEAGEQREPELLTVKEMGERFKRVGRALVGEVDLPAPSPAPLPAEVEAAFQAIADMVNGIRDLDHWLWGRNTMLSGLRQQVNRRLPSNLSEVATGCATLRAALTEARQPKRVSREWVERWAAINASAAHGPSALGRMAGDLSRRRRGLPRPTMLGTGTAKGRGYER